MCEAIGSQRLWGWKGRPMLEGMLQEYPCELIGGVAVAP